MACRSAYRILGALALADIEGHALVFV